MIHDLNAAQRPLRPLQGTACGRSQSEPAQLRTATCNLLVCHGKSRSHARRPLRQTPTSPMNGVGAVVAGARRYAGCWSVPVVLWSKSTTLSLGHRPREAPNVKSTTISARNVPAWPAATLTRLTSEFSGRPGAPHRERNGTRRIIRCRVDTRRRQQRPKRVPGAPTRRVGARTDSG